jgi:hypothetical protein
MKLFFGSKASQPGPVAVPDAIMKNKEAIDTLIKRHEFIEKKVAMQDNIAREKAKAKDKRGAMMALKSKKMLTAELETLGQARLTLEQQIMTLESSQTQQVAVQALQLGVQAQKQMNSQMNIDKIDQLMEDMQEQQDLQQDLQAKFTQVWGQGQPNMDDADLLAEYEEIEPKDSE